MRHTFPLAALAAAALIAASLVASTPAEAAPPIATAGFEAPVDTRPLVDLATTVEADAVEFTGTFDGEAADSDFELAIDDEGEGTFVLVDDDGERQELTLAIETATPERVAFTATDPSTGQSYTYDSTVPMKRLAFLIPVAFAAIPVATALYYLSIGAAIVVGGMLALEAAKAITKIIADNNKKPASQRRNYYPAYRHGTNKLMILPKGYTKAQALAKGKVRHDVWALSRDLAKALARDLHPGTKPIGAENHKGGYLHYHPAGHAPNMHSFFGGPQS